MFRCLLPLRADDYLGSCLAPFLSLATRAGAFLLPVFSLQSLP